MKPIGSISVSYPVLSQEPIRPILKIERTDDLALEKVMTLESELLKQEQVPVFTHHVLHGGMYTRSIFVPQGTVMTGALIEVATVLIIVGEVLVYIGSEVVELSGYNVVPAAKHRKQAFVAKSDVYMTSVFPTEATTIEQAEQQFTSEFEKYILLTENENQNKLK